MKKKKLGSTKTSFYIHFSLLPEVLLFQHYTASQACDIPGTGRRETKGA